MIKEKKQNNDMKQRGKRRLLSRKKKKRRGESGRKREELGRLARRGRSHDRKNKENWERIYWQTKTGTEEDGRLNLTKG